MFIKNVEDFTAIGRKIFLIFDGYREHMSLRVVEIFLKTTLSPKIAAV